MSTDNILLNSPALKSLKRAQLVGLCKRYGLRAAGKNVELVQRLQEHGRSDVLAATFSGDAPPCEDDDDIVEESGSKKAPVISRPSEAWSIVDQPSDVEVENVLKGVLTVKEFGSGPSQNKGKTIFSFHLDDILNALHRF